MTTASTFRPTFAEGPDFSTLAGLIAGETVRPGDNTYNEVRQLANFDFDRRPAAIVRAQNANDVAAAVRFARRNDLALAVRSGGHSVAGFSMINDALVIDLSQMRRVLIDPEKRTARVQSGATSGDLAGPAHAYGLALSTGDTSSVGIGGLTLGGGIGWMARKYGLAIDNLLSVELVTAEGALIKASATEHTELFWALRGGGGNFGIVTEFEFQLAPVGSIYGGALVLPATREVIRGFLEYSAQAPEELTNIANIMHAPPAPFVPADRVGELCLMVMVVFSGDAEAGERAVAPLRALAEPIADAVGPMPYPAIYNFTAAAAERHGGAVRSGFAHSFSDESIDAALEAMERATSPISMFQLRVLGGAVSRVGKEETAFGHRDKPIFFAVLGLWLDPEDDGEAHKQWTSALWEELRPSAAGVYVNFVQDEGEGRVRDAYPAGIYDRLANVKGMYDPENVFHFNQNIRPAR